ncbi:MAG: helix-turn-helix domain-containing protein [Acidaminococcaceae bacterium]|nr:helix-turn-helix domain-containing protein [Acidaminococcaceae bacterium]
MMDYKTLGANIQKMRRQLSLTQAELAEDVNLTTSYIGQIERGQRKVTLENLVLIADRLGTNINDLLTNPNTNYDKHDLILQNFLKTKSTKDKILAYKVLKLILK